MQSLPSLTKRQPVYLQMFSNQTIQLLSYLGPEKKKIKEKLKRISKCIKT